MNFILLFLQCSSTFSRNKNQENLIGIGLHKPFILHYLSFKNNYLDSDEIKRIKKERQRNTRKIKNERKPMHILKLNMQISVQSIRLQFTFRAPCLEFLLSEMFYVMNYIRIVKKLGIFFKNEKMICLFL